LQVVEAEGGGGVEGRHGDLTVHQQALAVAHAPEQTLAVVTAGPGSSSQAALALLTAAPAAARTDRWKRLSVSVEAV
jgi:hypothetical protein